MESYQICLPIIVGLIAGGIASITNRLDEIIKLLENKNNE
jgi:hypothetical protein